MLAIAAELPAEDAGWAYEMKWDGIRAIASVGGGEVRVFSRTGREVTETYPELQGLAAAAPGRELVLDGEIVAFGEDGWPSFEALQQRMNLASAGRASRKAADISVSLVAFDLLFADSRTLIDQQYRQRRAELDALGLDGPHWQTPPAFTEVSGVDVQAVSQRQHLEGIVAKRLVSRYEPGRRSAAWRKIKNRLRQEVVVGGWRPGKEGRTGQIGSLLVGVHGAEGLLYAGHVGTGFTQETLAMLLGRLTTLRRPTPPFTGEIPADSARDAVWTEPVLVIEIEFAAWTTAGRLRAAAYMGLRTDKNPADVVRELRCAAVTSCGSYVVRQLRRAGVTWRRSAGRPRPRPRASRLGRSWSA
jgi:bifunctional non-homologous end joining protein LigD